MQTTPVGQTADYIGTGVSHNSWKNRHRPKLQQLEKKKSKYWCKKIFNTRKSNKATPELSDPKAKRAEHSNAIEKQENELLNYFIKMIETLKEKIKIP